MEVLLINILNGLSFGFIIFLLGSGLSLVMGVLGVLNLAHGAMAMVGAYVGIWIARATGNFLLGVLGGVVVTGLLSFAIERWFLRRRHGLILDQALLTVGFLYIAQDVLRWIWGPHPHAIDAPWIFSGSIFIGKLGFPTYRLALMLIGLMVAIALYLFVEKTRTGAIIRAGMDDKEMIVALGVDYQRTATLVFVLGAGLAAFAGFMGAPVFGAYLTLGVDALLLAIFVVIVGGMGSVQGAFLGAMVIGLFDAFSKAYVPDFSWHILYILLIVILVLRPEGLLGKRV
ncbi:MAG: branched-chain amino acid ABC transporter permease [Dehalococcoidales bacterium]|jgi:branched-chain amino acid transport system permease protein|nr:branched-chain amino acid ABC transporter permease [Dehalococcoidales bacterium]|tara:strand:- start:356 stop:1213 length:858 start_codon:yes stop_codon:yes gene_type:complete